MKEPVVYLGHILSSADAIGEYITGMQKREFLSSPKTQDAVIRRLEVIGEATKCLTENVRKRDPHIPWKQIAGMRDILIHEYFMVDLNFVWHTVKHNVPDLAKRIRKLLKDASLEGTVGV